MLPCPAASAFAGGSFSSRKLSERDRAGAPNGISGLAGWPSVERRGVFGCSRFDPAGLSIPKPKLGSGGVMDAAREITGLLLGSKCFVVGGVWRWGCREEEEGRGYC